MTDKEEPQPQPEPEPAQPQQARPDRKAAAGRFVRHRATQLVAVGLLGLVLGGGLVALFDRDGGDDGPGRDRGGHSRMDDRHR